MFYFLIGVIICFISMYYYDWPDKLNLENPESKKEYFSAIMWSAFIILFWPIVVAVWICGAIMQYFSRDVG